MTKVGFLVAGFKGFNFLKEIHRDCEVAFVSSYVANGTLFDSFTNIKVFCQEHGYAFIDHSIATKTSFNAADILFAAGWQYIKENADHKLIVFHDSLLPKFRGFCPTVTALVQGETNIGVTAFKATLSADSGSIYGQECVGIEYPIKVKDAYSLLFECYAQVAKKIVKKIENNSLEAIAQDKYSASYSVWRDKWDYYVDWNWPSDKISLFINAVSWPYAGAKTTYEEKEIIIDEVDVAGDLIFENRQPGKMWELKKGIPLVICGKGMIRIVLARDSDGARIKFTHLRRRFGSLGIMP